MVNYEFKRDGETMNVFGFMRYEVRIDGRTAGIVFQFRTERYASSFRWMAQRIDGTLYGWLTPYRTRKAAAEALSE